VTHFNRQRSDASPLAVISDLNQSGCAETLIAPVWFYVEIIQASDQPAVFHCVLKSEHDVSYVLMFYLDNPDVPQALITENSGKCPSRTRRVEFIASFSVELSHQAHQQGDVVGTCASHLPIIERSAVRVESHQRVTPDTSSGRAQPRSLSLDGLPTQTIALSNPGAFLGRDGFQVASVHSIAERSPIVCSLPIEVDSRGHATAMVGQVLPKSTVSLPCGSAESPHPFTRADLAISEQYDRIAFA
jgi:hypothetical protein